MKPLLLSLLLLVAIIVIGQPTAVTATRTVPVATLEVGYYTTTALVFPAAIVDGDKGYSELLAAPQSKVSNVLNLKAAVKYFTPTNLHIYTADQKVYTFRVVYHENPGNTTYDIATLPKADSVRANPLLSIGSNLDNERALQQAVTAVRNANAFLHKSARADDIRVQLRSIHQIGSNLFFKFQLTNASGLLYHLDFVRAYITDKQRGKRSSVQQRELIAVYQDSIMAFDQSSTVTLVIAVPKFTLTEGKRFHFEFFEKAGGRHVKLAVKNRQLYKAQRLNGFSTH